MIYQAKVLNEVASSFAGCCFSVISTIMINDDDEEPNTGTTLSRDNL